MPPLTFSAEFNAGVGEMGMRPHEFWAMTYAEFAVVAEGWRRMRIRKNNDIVSLAWLIGSYVGFKKLPDLQGLLQTEELETKEQSPDVMFGIVRMLNAAYGGTETAEG